MTGLFGTLNTSASGMRAQQIALQTTGHNLSNTNTKGYSRQRVSMQTSVPQSFTGVGQMGTGVQIGGVIRVTDDYITRQLHNELSSLEQQENISEVLGQLEVLFNEPSNTGMAHQMGEVFASWSNLAANPDLSSAKKLVISQAGTFVDTVNHLSNQIGKLGKDTVKRIEQDVRDFNSTAEQLKKVNDQIFNAKIKGEEPNDLLDSQDRLVGELQRISGADIDSTTDKYGRVFVSLNGKDTDDETKKVEIVTAGEFKKIEIDENTPGGVKFVDQETDPKDIKIDFGKGSIKGFQEAYVKVEKTEDDLDEFVLNFAKAVNTIATDKGTGKIPNTDKNGDDQSKDALKFFTFDPKAPSAKNISVNPALVDDPKSLVTGTDFGNSVAGDGSRAKAIADLQNTTLVLGKITDGELSTTWDYDKDLMSFKNQANGSTLFDHYNDIVTSMGIEKQQADNMVANQSDLVSLLEQRQESMSGVDLNEEVVDMIRFQSAFQANARVISTINDMLDTLINRMGV